VGNNVNPLRYGNNQYLVLPYHFHQNNVFILFDHLRLNSKSVVITTGSFVLGLVGCLRPNSSAMTIVSSNGNKGNCSRISTTKSEYSIR